MGGRSGTHATGRPLYITGNILPASNGVEIRHFNGSQGIGIGYNSLYGAGTAANNNVNLIPKGTGGVGIGTTTASEKLEVVGTIKATDINFTGLPVFADEAAATTGGLETGDLYRTATGEIRIKL